MSTPVSVSGRDDGVLEVTLTGDIDYLNASVVTHMVAEAVRAARPSIVRVDVGGVTFLDSSGIGALVSGMRAAHAVGAEYQVARPTGRVLGQLRVSGLVDLFGIGTPRPTVADGEGTAR